MKLKRMALFWSLAALLILIAVSPLHADRVVEYDNATFTIHDQPNEELAKKFLASKPEKIDISGDWLILPRYEVDLQNMNGVNTLFAVRNITDQSQDISLIFDGNVGATVFQSATLGPKEVKSFSLRNVADLEADPFGIAGGYVQIIAEGALDPTPRKIIHGDYFLIDADNNFASGDRLINYTAFDEYYDLCHKFEVRFFNGGGFDGGTEISFFINDLQANDVEFAYAVYLEAGGAPVSTGSVGANFNSVKIPISVFTGVPFGVIEFTFNNTVGHVSSVFSALGKFSVGVNALCEEPRVFIQ